jgi:predicted RNase H-like nuclease (RuvC/YqgF family)
VWFSDIAVTLLEFPSLLDFKEADVDADTEADAETAAEAEAEAEDANARGRIAALEAKANQHSHDTAMFQDKVTQLSTDFGLLVGEVSALRSASAGIQRLLDEVSALKTQITQKLNDPVVEQLSKKFSKLRKRVSVLKTQIAAMSLTVIPFQRENFISINVARVRFL